MRNRKAPTATALMQLRKPSQGQLGRHGKVAPSCPRRTTNASWHERARHMVLKAIDEVAGPGPGLTLLPFKVNGSDYHRIKCDNIITKVP